MRKEETKLGLRVLSLFDGNVYVTDTGYAFEGMEIFLDVVERRIKEEI